MVRSDEEGRDFRLDILNKWSQKYKFSSFVVFGEEVLIVRQGSVGVFRNIEKELFEDESLTYSELEVIEKELLTRNRFQTIRSFGKKMEENHRDFGIRVTRYH